MDVMIGKNTRILHTAVAQAQPAHYIRSRAHGTPTITSALIRNPQWIIKHYIINHWMMQKVLDMIYKTIKKDYADVYATEN